MEVYQVCEVYIDFVSVLSRRRRHRDGGDDIIEISGDEDCEIVDNSGPSDFDASGGDASEDEDAVIERRRRERQDKLAKLATKYDKP